MLKTTKIIAALVVALGVAACGSTSRDPVGTGKDYNELKTSPCACTEIPMVVPDHGQSGQGVA